MRIKLLALFLSFSVTVAAQTGWKTLNLPPAGRYDDVFFLNDSIGWVAGGTGGMIYHTRDGGETWTHQFTAGKYLRSIEFISENVGFCGSLDSTFYKTTDGGKTWVDLFGTTIPRLPGICGISAPDHNTIYASGVWFFPAFIIKSVDGGNSWTTIDMSAYARGLVDIYFLNKDTGFACGQSVNPARGGIILYTTNGGNTWEIKDETMIPNDYVWKLQSPDKKHIYAAIQNAPGTFIRTMRSPDAGDTWVTSIVQTKQGYIQLVGFLDKFIGWTGGAGELYKTTDGGLNWSIDSVSGSAYNRFFRINSKIAFMSGAQIYKYNGLLDKDPGIPAFDEIHGLKIYPNPSATTVRIEAVFANPTTARLEVFTSDGKLMDHLFSGRITGDSRTFDLSVVRYPKGVYYVSLRTNEGVITRELVRL